MDLTNIVGLAYRKTWNERHYLLKMAAIPFLVKLACFSSLKLSPDGISEWWQGIMLLPSFLVEGWFLAHWARTVMLGTHRWPFQSSGNLQQDKKVLYHRAQGVMAGMVAFALINFLLSGYYAVLTTQLTGMAKVLESGQPDPRISAIALIFIITALTVFRFIWIHIPLAATCSLEKSLSVIKSFSITFRMVGIWLVCVVPTIFIAQIIGEILLNLSPDDKMTPITDSLFLVVRLILDMVKNLLCTAAMSYFFIILLKGKKT